MATNGIDWLLALREAWPALCWAAGALFGWYSCRRITARLLRAQVRELHNLRQLNGRLADDNERMVEYMQYLREK